MRRNMAKKQDNNLVEKKKCSAIVLFSKLLCE